MGKMRRPSSPWISDERVSGTDSIHLKRPPELITDAVSRVKVVVIEEERVMACLFESEIAAGRGPNSYYEDRVCEERS